VSQKSKSRSRPTKARPDRARFVQEYLIDLNATQAAIRCGYSPRTAGSQGGRLLKDVEISKAIDAAIQDRRDAAKVSAERIMEEADILALGEIGEILDFTGDTVCLKPANQISEHGRRLLSAVKVKRTFVKGEHGMEPVEVLEFKLWDKPAAIRLALQHRGKLTEKHEHTGKDGGPIETKDVTDPKAELAMKLAAIAARKRTPATPKDA